MSNQAATFDEPRRRAQLGLMANNPSGDGTCADAPLEWLAFRSLPLLPSFPRGSRIITTGVVGRGNDMTFKWPVHSGFVAHDALGDSD